MYDECNFLDELPRFIGQTVTIYTTSGGESGFGFTGVLVAINNSFVRLITQIGPAPGCALGSCCGGGYGYKGGRNYYGGEYGKGEYGKGEYGNGYGRCGNYGRIDCNFNSLGSIVDIPLNRIASFVHNAIGSGI
ncbi:hypothetical protein ACJDT4_19860 [Clostridium neuense]|uniref:Uncharacterized protein n=1 Tax=Clostridium neuense TaxID=1728934 RepID=A0ABW8TNT5_9CLOT